MDETSNSPPSEERLEQLDEDIDEARRDARDDVPGMGGEPDAGMFTDTEPAFYESGEESDIDDQTIAPPG